MAYILPASSAILAPWDRPGQQDVAEYWTFLRNAILLRLSDECVKPPRAQVFYHKYEKMLTLLWAGLRQSDVFDAIFSSGIKNSRTCRQCSDESDRWDMRETLMLPLAHATKEHRLGEYIDSVFSANLLEARSCPNCGQVNTTFEKDVIEKPPHTLVVHLVRIAYKEISGQYTETKIIDRVDFPERLDLSRHVAEPSVRPVLYELKAAVHHQHLMGRRAANGEYIVRNDQGHYKASVHGPDGRWREVEDDLVRGDITFRDVLNPGLRWTPSILVYERMAQPTGSSSAPVDLTEAVVPTQTVAPATHTAPATNGATTKGKATLARKKAADATQGGRVTSARKKAAAKALATGTATTTITTKKAKKGRARQTREKVELY